MEIFKSGDHQFNVFDVIAKEGTKGSSLTIILDVPYAEELSRELECFRWKDVKVSLVSTDSKAEMQNTFRVSDIKAKPFSEGPRIRFSLRMPYEAKDDVKAVKMRWHNVTFEMEIIQKELDMEYEETGDDEQL